ncbi:phosphotransferase family protein [Vibrio quintilis]|uniref:Phosphotransferase enzyme family protein n=1 Tax=Vibrio quintilis TaxID=1117707 RepID=A0A1M7YPR8_9VIBR|nr:phosphotransferase [Vibrio quintilis]SHO54633.1 Phosphotransferase enzyme family protein [Vibrio quintilis]
MDFDKKFDRREPTTDFSQAKLQRLLCRSGYEPAGCIKKLSGGYSNLNYIFESKGTKWILRLSGKSVREFLGELSVLEQVETILPVPRVLQFETDAPEVNRHIAIMSFVEGVPLSQTEDDLPAAAIESIARSLGYWMAKMHQISFHTSGFFGSGGEIVETFTPFQEKTYHYYQHLLSEPLLAKRLGSEMLEKLTRYIAINRSLLESLPAVMNLTHSDFNQKNLLVENKSGHWQIAAILDWEFAFSGSPMIDFGNFFRYDTELSPHYEQPLVEAYLANGGVLDHNWKAQGKYLDLLSMMQFLTREGDYPRTFATARKVIENIVG